MHATVRQIPHHEVRSQHHKLLIIGASVVIILALAVAIVMRLQHVFAARELSKKKSESKNESKKLRGLLSRSKDSHLANLMKNKAVSNISELPEELEK